MTQFTIANLNDLLTNITTNITQVNSQTVATAGTGRLSVGIVGNIGAILDAAGQNAGSPPNFLLMGGQFNTSPTVITSGNASPLQLDANGNLKVNISAGGAGGTSSSFAAAFPATGTAIGVKNGANMVNLVADASNNLLVNLATAIPTGANVIGAVTQSGGPWTGNITQFGGTNISTGTGAGGAGIPRVTISNDSSLAANQSVNTAQFGGTNVVTGTGASGAGIPRVTVANDSNILATQSGTWTVQPGNTANTTPWLTTDTADGPVAAGTAATKSQLGGVVFNTALPAPTNGQQVALQADNQGVLLIRGQDRTATGTITAVNAAVTVSTQGCGAVGIILTANTNCTVQFEGTVDGSNWVAVGNISSPTGGSLLTAGLTSSGATGTWITTVGGFQQFRARITAVGATPTVTISLDASAPGSASAAPFQNLIGGLNSNNNTYNTAHIDAVQGDAQNWGGGNFLLLGTQSQCYVFNGTTYDRIRSGITGGQSNTGVQNVSIGGFNYNGGANNYVPVSLAQDVAGHAALYMIPAGRQTYKLAGFVTPAATPTDVITIQGSASKTIRINKISISVVSTAAGIADVLLIRRSTANSGGTSTAPTIAKADTNNGAATAVVAVYTANAASVGTVVANLGARKVTGTTIALAEWDASHRGSDPFVLRGTSDFLAINGNGDTLLTGEVWAYDIEWTEE